MVIFAAVCSLIVAACSPSAPAPQTPEAPGQPQSASAPAAPPAPPAAPEKVKVAFVTNNASDFWKIAEAGTKKAAEELGCEVLFRIPATGSAQEQQQIMEDLIVKGVSGIAISPNDPANWTDTLNEFASKVNLITQDSDAPQSNRACYIGTNNYDAGVAAGELLKKVLPNGGKIMMFVGKLDAQNAQDRKRGIEDTIKDTGITVIDTLTDETDRAKAMSNAQDTIVKYPDVACLVGLWSYNGPALLNAVRDSGKEGQVKIVCFDEEEATLLGVSQKAIEGTIVQQPFEFGYQSVKLMNQLAKGDRSGIPESKQIFVPVKTITAENVEEFRATLSQQIGR
ncbi:MAG: sugar-binding protein [Candidatus Hydrogenedentes bacterium]|nr:sugar-binding protein [Candidatus Hydrogenedentota bacterium]